MHGLLSRALDLQMFHRSCNRRGFGTTNCGAASVLFLQHKVQGTPLPTSDHQLQSASDGLREDFRMSHDGFPMMPRPWCWGMGVFDVMSVTANLLKQHGVPEGAAMSRSKLLLQSLGHDHVKQAVQGSSPWKTLKSLANQQSPPFQLVLPDELAHVVQTRQAKAKAGKRPNGVKLPSLQHVEVDPAKLQLAEGTFRMPDLTEAKQIQASQVGPLATGWL